MQFTLVATTALPLQVQLQWIWYSDHTGSFITGDDRQAFALATLNPGELISLTSSFPAQGPRNLPIPASLYQELAAIPRQGLQLLEASAYQTDGEGDLLRTLVFGPDYGHYMLHPASGLVLSLRSGSMALFDLVPGAGFKSVDKTRTRGSAVLAFAGHPAEPLIAYGDNAGNFHAHRFDATGFGKASKIAARQRKASRLAFSSAGNMLMVGGMGYLSTYAYSLGKFVAVHDVSTAVRDFVWVDNERVVLINQGIGGIAAYQHNEGGFTRLESVEAPGAVKNMAVSNCLRYLAVTLQDSSTVCIYGMSK